MLVKENGQNNVYTLQLNNKRAKDLQLHISNQIFQTEIKSNLEAFIELKKEVNFLMNLL